jgi:two-component system response regulator
MKEMQPPFSKAEWTVLIVDDNPDEVKIAARALSKIRKSMTVHTVSTGEGALEQLRCMETLPSVIFLDLKMPGMSGFDVLRSIRSDERLKGIRVIVVSNSSLESDRKESYAAGADWFLQKAFDIDEFSREIKSLLDCLMKD